MKKHKIQVTIRMDAETYRAAKLAERRTGLPLSVVIVDAARETLIPAAASTEALIRDKSVRILGRLESMERALGQELAVISELLGLCARIYLNHTPEIPEPERDAASLSGRARFARLVRQLKRNLHDGASILNLENGQHVQ